LFNVKITLLERAKAMHPRSRSHPRINAVSHLAKARPELRGRRFINLDLTRARPAKWTDLSLAQLAKAEGKIIIPTRWEEARRGGRETEKRSHEYTARLQLEGSGEPSSRERSEVPRFVCRFCLRKRIT